MLAGVGTEREDGIDSVLVTAINKIGGGFLKCCSQRTRVCHCALFAGLRDISHSCLRDLERCKGHQRAKYESSNLYF